MELAFITMILQVIPGTETLIEKYGLAGLMIVSMGYVVVKLWLKQNKQEQKNELRFEDQGKKLDKYIEQDKLEILEALDKSSNALNNNTAVMQKLLEVIDKKQ